ncbi:MAG: ABC transporter ATP-binding protein [Planktomarina sp.]
MSNPVLQFTNLSKAYNLGKPNEIAVLTQTGGVINAGEVVSLVAPSGAGKSTLLHMVGLLDTPDSGSLKVLDMEMSGASDRMRTMTRRTTLGFVYQFHHLLPEFTALENIVLPQLSMGRSRVKADAHAKALLDQVGLVDRASHRPSELSGGEQQRVAFCRALANDPKLLLADEPTGNLDPETSDHVFSVLMDLVRATGLSALIATHNLELAGRMDRKVKLWQGKVTDA